MKKLLPQQDLTEITSDTYRVYIKQRDGAGDISIVCIAKENAERFCTLVIECAREIQNGGVKSEQ